MRKLTLFEGDGDDIQAALTEWTGQRTVPNVFIGRKHIGGCDCKSINLFVLFTSVLCYVQVNPLELTKYPSSNIFCWDKEKIYHFLLLVPNIQ